MEHEKNDQGAVGGEAWDAVPRDGPAVFIANTFRLAAGEGLHGAWVRLDRPRPAVVAEIGRIIGGRDLDRDQIDWSVIDQVGMGSAMVDEAPISDLLGQVREPDGE